MSAPRVAIAHLGARKHYQEPILFHQWGVLEHFYTDFYAGHTPVVKFLRTPGIYQRAPQVLKKALDRYDEALSRAPITHYPTLSYEYTKRLKETSPQNACQVYNWVGKEFCQRIIQSGLGQADTMYGFPVSSLELFRYAKQKGVRCILDQIIAERALTYQLIVEEEEVWKDWSITPFVIQDAEKELIDREHQEHHLSDHIVCGSEFVKDTLIAKGIDANKISVVAIGRSKETLPVRSHQESLTPKQRGDQLRVLFGGTVGLRKGVPYLLEALRSLKGKIPVTCKIAGSLEIQSQRVAEYSDVAEFLGRVPRSQMAELYNWADVFVLPSICEGSAMVTYEALLSGLPVITTYNAGSLVRHGVDGYIVNIRDVAAIAERLEQMYGVGLVSQQLLERQTYVSDVFSNAQEILRSVVCQSSN
jgi:glycosyltransferase involved in cell wall biosynthesis